jgi:DNA-binding XRE family transcriptional regulator
VVKKKSTTSADATQIVHLAEFTVPMKLLLTARQHRLTSVPMAKSKKQQPLQDGATLLKAWRTERGLSLAKIGEACGISRQTLYDYERGRKRPRIAQAMAVRDATGGAVPVESWAVEPTVAE